MAALLQRAAGWICDLVEAAGVLAFVLAIILIADGFRGWL